MSPMPRRGNRYGRQMDLDAQHSMLLTGRELLLLGAGLKAYLKDFDAHRLEDAAASHPKVSGPNCKTPSAGFCGDSKRQLRA